MTLKQCQEQALALNINDRAELAHVLLESLDHEGESAYDDELDREIERRVQEIEAGTAIGRPAYAALDDIRDRLP